MTLLPIQIGVSFEHKASAPRTADPADVFDTLVSASATNMSGQKAGKNSMVLIQNRPMSARGHGIPGDVSANSSQSAKDKLSQTSEEQKKTDTGQEDEGESTLESGGLQNGAAATVVIEMKMRGLSGSLASTTGVGIAATVNSNLPGTALKPGEIKRNDRGETSHDGLNGKLLLLHDDKEPRRNGAAPTDKRLDTAAVLKRSEKEPKSSSDWRINPDFCLSANPAEQFDGKQISWFDSAGKFQESIATAVRDKLGELSSPDRPAPVLQAMRDAASGGIRELRLRLHPVDFGQLSVHLQNRGDSMRIVVHSQTTAAHVRLVAEKDELRRSLEVQGVSVKEIIFRAPNDSAAETAVAQNSEPSGLNFGQPERRTQKSVVEQQDNLMPIQFIENETLVSHAKPQGIYI